MVLQMGKSDKTGKSKKKDRDKGRMGDHSTANNNLDGTNQIDLLTGLPLIQPTVAAVNVNVGAGDKQIPDPGL